MREELLYSMKDMSDLLVELKDKNLVIFGAGSAGQQIYFYLQQHLTSSNICFCDNNIGKQNETINPPIYSVKKALTIPNAIFLVGFLRNVPEKIHSAVQCLANADVLMERIRIIDMSINYIDDIWALQAQTYIEKLMLREEKEQIKKVRAIKFLTFGFSKDKEVNPGGGPVGAICMQKSCLGSAFNEIRLEYPYYLTVEDMSLLFIRHSFIMRAVEAVRIMCEHDKDTIYIANDIFSAFGLYTLGKNYCLLFHAQGDVVKEMTLWGYTFSQAAKETIYKIEKLSVENAYRVLFPSKGAEIYFKESFLEKPSFHVGEPMYNTVTDFPIPVKVEGIEEDNSSITFFSIGQMTLLKGMDRIPPFLEQLLEHTDKKIRWIVVANGVLKEEVQRQAEEIAKKTNRFEYINIDYKLSHAKIFYLMDICDIYIMLHRVSIFDFSTLEAMYCKKPIILSDIPGNDEYNKENNIMLVKDNVNWAEIVEYISDGKNKGEKNREVYETYFSEKPFVKQYHSFFNQFIEAVESEM